MHDYNGEIANITVVQQTIYNFIIYKFKFVCFHVTLRNISK